MRIVNFFDGAQSETTPTIGNIVASALVKYPDDASYEGNEQGSPQTGNLYYNETLNLVRYYNGTEWISIVDEKTVQTVENKTVDGSSTGNNVVKTVASNVEVTPVGNLASDNTEDALNELQGDIDVLDSRLDDAEADILDLQTNKENKSEKGQPNGYCDLDSSGLVPSIRLPSYVDDVLEYANFAAFPVTGETGKIYVALDTNFQFRWSGSIYVQLAASPVNSVNGQTGVVVLAVDDLNDVVAPTPADDEVLTWHAGTSRWINKSVPRNLDALSDVDLTTTPPVINNVLKYDGTNWIPGTGGAGQGDVNFITNSDIESDLSGYALYKDAVQSRPVDGTGGTPSGGLTIARSTVNPLNKTASLLVSKNNTNCQGEGFNYDFTIDSMYKAKVLNIEIPYIIDSGTFTAASPSQDSDLIVYIYDVTNNQLIEPSSFKFLSNNTSLSDTFSATFQTSATGTQYRLIWHVATSSTATWAIKFDEIKVTPSKYIYGTPITDWQSYTPTGTFTTNTTYTGRWRRVGQNMEIQGRVTFSGLPNTVSSFTFNLPSGYSIDTLVNQVSNNVGFGFLLDNGVNSYLLGVLVNTSTSLLPVNIATNSTYAINNVITNSLPIALNNLDYIDFYATVAIVGWSSSVQMSDRTDTRVVTAQMNGTPGSALSASFTDISGGGLTKGFDTHNALTTSTGSYLVPVSGYYKASFNSEIARTTGTASQAFAVRIFNVTKAFAIPLGGANFVLASAESLRASGSNIIYADAGDVLRFQSWVAGGTGLVWSATLLGNSYSLERISGPQAIAASESVSVSAFNVSGQTFVNNIQATITGWTKEQDTHNAFNASTGIFTAPVNGLYTVTLQTCMTIFTANTGGLFSVIVPSSGSAAVASVAFGNATAEASAICTHTFRLLAGQTIATNCVHSNGVNRSLFSTDGTRVKVSINKVGN